MVYESVILKIMLIFYQKLRDAYYGSGMLALLSRLVSWVRELILDSEIIKFIVNRKIITASWEGSGFYGIYRRITEKVGCILKRPFETHEHYLSSSIIYRLLVMLSERLEIFVCVFLFGLIIAPHSYWFNGFNILGAGGLGLLLLFRKIRSREEAAQTKLFSVWIVVYIISIVLAQLTSVYPIESLNFFMFSAASFLIFFIVISVVDSLKKLNLIINTVLAAVSVTGLYGMWQGLVTGVAVDPALTDINLINNMPGRIYSTMGNPNNYAALLVLTLPYFIAQAWNHKKLFHRLIFAAMAMPALAALLLTGTRSAWMSFALGVIVFLFFKDPRLLPLLIIGGLVCLPLAPSWVYVRITTIFNTNDSSAMYRQFIYKTVRPMISDFWVSGIGLGTGIFGRVLQNYNKFGLSLVAHSHNLYYQLLLEAGIAAFVSFILFMLNTAKLCVNSIINRSSIIVNTILMAGLGSIAGIMLMGYAEYIWFYPRMLMIFWVNLGIVYGALKIIKEKRHIEDKNIV